MARHHKRRKHNSKKYPPYDATIWVEGFVLNEKTGLYETVKYKVRVKC